ncbi:N-acetyltransferase [Robertkochia aurantiaca]|uniref:N-acetyltransferase n=1 Tax=Robertkochia aurantiaca TaxID=2873700 RepID=UPI001CCFB207|nr:N-acetyltransferase [Robertkochia sp. 3YJGBD-33]
MKSIRTKKLTSLQKYEVLNLWNNEYPEKLFHGSISDFETWLESLENPSYILLIDNNRSIKGWYVDFDRDNEKWFVIILDSKIQGKGLGRIILNLAKENKPVLNGWVIDHDKDRKKNGAVYKSPLQFYLKNNFQIISGERFELGKISAVKITWKK